MSLTNSAGAINANYTYTPFGQTVVSGSPSGNSQTFTGREDDGTGLLYYRSRYYDPRAGRFLQSDSIRLAGGLNAYVYANDNPISLTDAAGTSPASVAQSFLNNYNAMQAANWRQIDSYFHCMANCEAMSSGGSIAYQLTALSIDVAREVTDSLRKGDSALTCQFDMAAALYSLQAGLDGGKCMMMCAALAPPNWFYSNQ